MLDHYSKVGISSKGSNKEVGLSLERGALIERLGFCQRGQRFQCMAICTNM